MTQSKVKVGDRVRVDYADGSFWSFGQVVAVRHAGESTELTLSPDHARVKLERRGSCAVYEVPLAQVAVLFQQDVDFAGTLVTVDRFALELEDQAHALAMRLMRWGAGVQVARVRESLEVRRLVPARLMPGTGNDACECGREGVHPWPIGGGWGFACDRCRSAAVRSGVMGDAAWVAAAAGCFGLDWPSVVAARRAVAALRMFAVDLDQATAAELEAYREASAFARGPYFGAGVRFDPTQAAQR
jgi:hypothetical protein